MDTFEPMGDVASRFAASGLPTPFVPEALVDTIRRTPSGTWTTRQDDHDLYDFRWFAAEAATGMAPDYVAFGHAGHGVNSLALSYYLVQRPLAILLQIGWGGAYTNSELSDQHVTRALQEVPTFVERFSKLSGSALLIAASEFYGGRAFWWGSDRQAIPNDLVISARTLLNFLRESQRAELLDQLSA